MQKLSALILAAGKGTRLRPITNTIPKCLVEIGGKTMLDSWIEKIRELNPNIIAINSHYMHEKVEIYLKEKYGESKDIKVVYERKLLGTAGTIIKNKNLLYAENCIIVHCDNYYSNNLLNMIRMHNVEYEGTSMTMGTFFTENGKECGLVEKNNEGILVDYKEKNSTASYGEANAAIYILRKECLDWLERSCSDSFEFTIDVIPKLLGRIQIHPLEGTIIDVGTPDRLEKARQHNKISNKQ